MPLTLRKGGSSVNVQSCQLAAGANRLCAQAGRPVDKALILRLCTHPERDGQASRLALVSLLHSSVSKAEISRDSESPISMTALPEAGREGFSPTVGIWELGCLHKSM